MVSGAGERVASAESSSEASSETAVAPRHHHHPIVLVPGFLGNETHWHLHRMKRRHHGERFIVVSPGPLSSHHDRACEIFYSLKGGTCDYGEAHSSCCGHDRFGRSNGSPALAEWDEQHPVDLVGHSIGGMTARVLQQLLTDQAFPGHRTSAAWVRSITTLASPLNGDPVVFGLGLEPEAVRCQHSAPPTPLLPPTPLCSPCQLASLPSTTSGDQCTQPGALRHGCDESEPLPSLFAEAERMPVRVFSAGWLLTVVAHALMWLSLEPLLPVDLHLDHWRGLAWRRGSFFSSTSALMRALAWRGSFGQSYDNAAYEVSPAAARRLNARTRTDPHTIYVSFSAVCAPSPRSILRAALDGPPLCQPAVAGSLLERAPLLHSAPVLLRRLTAALRESVVFAFSLIVRFGGGRMREEACEQNDFTRSQWEAHDGLLSSVGQRAPLGEPWRSLPSGYFRALRGKGDVQGAGMTGEDAAVAATPSTADVCAEATPPLETGVWHVHELGIDHFAVCGGPLASPRSIDSFWSDYLHLRDVGFTRRA